MLDEHSYLWEKLYNAVTSLATGTGRLQERLVNAYVPGLLALRPGDFPEDLRPAFESVQVFMTAVNAKGDEGSLAATAAAMHDMEAIAIAQQIVRLYDQIARERVEPRAEMLGEILGPQDAE